MWTHLATQVGVMQPVDWRCALHTPWLQRKWRGLNCIEFLKYFLAANLVSLPGVCFVIMSCKYECHRVYNAGRKHPYANLFIYKFKITYFVEDPGTLTVLGEWSRYGCPVWLSSPVCLSSMSVQYGCPVQYVCPVCLSSMPVQHGCPLWVSSMGD